MKEPGWPIGEESPPIYNLEEITYQLSSPVRLDLKQAKVHPKIS